MHLDANTGHLEERLNNFINIVMRQLEIQLTREEELGRSNEF